MDITKLTDQELKNLFYQEQGRKEEALTVIQETIRNITLIDQEVINRRQATASGQPVPDLEPPDEDEPQINTDTST